jgi:hypothetical protein
MTLNGTERPYSTDGHIVLENNARAARWKVLSRDFRFEKLLDIRGEVLSETTVCALQE